MVVKNLKLKNFRNYKDEYFEFDEDLNIIYGNNAQGKTNILEAIYIFSVGKSNRCKKDGEIINFDEKKAEADICFSSKNRELKANLLIEGDKRKKFFINEIFIKKNSELVGNLNTVYLGPEYLSLIREGPKARRKNIDILICQIKPKYLSALSDYKKIIDQKNNILKNDRIDTLLLDVLNEKILDLSNYIISTRFNYIKKIEKIANNLQKEISSEKEDFSMNYISCGTKINDENIKNLSQMSAEKMLELKEREIRYKECIFGPHRDDIEFLINGKEIKLFASQGQQKTAVLVQKIAEAELIKEETGEYPVLLLDDIMSEFDTLRQDYIINKIKDMQIFITCTDSEKFKNIKKGRLIKIEKGSVKECTYI